MRSWKYLLVSNTRPVSTIKQDIPGVRGDVLVSAMRMMRTAKRKLRHPWRNRKEIKPNIRQFGLKQNKCKIFKGNLLRQTLSVSVVLGGSGWSYYYRYERKMNGKGKGMVGIPWLAVDRHRRSWTWLLEYRREAHLILTTHLTFGGFTGQRIVDLTTSKCRHHSASTAG